jgi:tetratricopeptide (TPR) repeat protein
LYRSPNRRRFPRWSIALAAILGLLLLLVTVYNLPPVEERLAWRISELRARIKYAISPPEEAVFTPDPTLAAVVQATMAAMAPTHTPTQRAPTPTPAVTPTPTVVPTPLPPSALLTGIRHEYEKWNNCGPATLSMTLSKWGYEGDQVPIASFVKPNPRDKNVMPYELEAFVESETDLEMVVRYGGTLELAKRFLAAGYPFMVEKGYDFPGADKGWMGHYQLLVGYDDEQQRFTAYDSYTGGPNLPVSYEQLEDNWRAFNYTFLIPFPADREEEVMALLGDYADETTSLQIAAQKASEETVSLTGREQLFAWFNRGTSLYQLQDYGGAAAAYDEYFRLYELTDPELRPWRMLWYQTGPYFAYYFTGRLAEVMNLATVTLVAANEPALEESWYWRARARADTGDTAGALEDLRTSLAWHPDFAPSLALLQALGATP